MKSLFVFKIKTSYLHQKKWVENILACHGMEPNIQRNADGRRRIIVRTPCVHNRPDGSAQAAYCGRLCRSSIAESSLMVALSACPGRREVAVWASYWRRGCIGSAIGLTKVARQSAVRAQHGPYCSHTEKRFFWYLANIRRSGGFLRSPWSQRGLRPVWWGLEVAVETGRPSIDRS